MRIVFLGSPAFALPTLQALLDGPHEVVAVVTQPDRPAGRGHAATPPPVKALALAHDLPVLQPERVSEPGPVAQLAALAPDVLVVAAFGQILRQRVLDLPRRGALNVHASLLPRWRGASPIAASIQAGDAVTGVTVMEVVRALDAGPMVARVAEPIQDADTTGTLEARLAVAGARLLAETLEPWAERRLKPQTQDEGLVTYAPQLKREDARLDWTLPAVDLWRRVRAFNPWPIAFTTWRDEELRVLEARVVESGPASDAPPGSVVADERPLPARERGLLLQTGAGLLELVTLQRPGKRPVSGLDFLRGQRHLVGSRFGS